MAETFPKEDKLKSRKTIEELFTSGKSVSQYPLRLAYMENAAGINNKFGVSVSKKYFKNAVDRNYVKRLLREVYRKNQGLLKDGTTPSYSFMLLYQGKEILTFDELTKKTILLFEKFRKTASPKTASEK